MRHTNYRNSTTLFLFGLTCISLLFPDIVLAATSGVEVNLSPEQTSILPQMLERVVGNSALEYLMGVKDATLPTTFDSSIFMTFVKILLSGTLSAGAVLLTYNSVMGVYNTATQGEFLGKKWESAMVPFRAGLSITAIIPMPVYGGLCLAQVLIVAGAGMGIGLMDSAWHAMVKSMVVEKSMVVAPAYDPAITGTIKSMLLSKVCVITMDGIPDGSGDAATGAAKKLVNMGYFQRHYGGSSKRLVHTENKFKTAFGSEYSALYRHKFIAGALKPKRGTKNKLVTYRWIFGPMEKIKLDGSEITPVSCGEIEFKSGVVPVEKYVVQTKGKAASGIRNKPTANPLQILQEEAQNSITEHNLKRMKAIWTSPKLTRVALDLAYDKKSVHNPSGGHKLDWSNDYTLLQNLATKIQTSLNGEIRGAKFAADQDVNPKINGHRISDVTPSKEVFPKPSAGGTSAQTAASRGTRQPTAVENLVIASMTQGGGAMAGSMYWKINDLQAIYSNALRMGQPNKLDVNKIIDEADNFRRGLEKRGMFNGGLWGAALGGAILATGVAGSIFTGGTSLLAALSIVGASTVAGQTTGALMPDLYASVTPSSSNFSKDDAELISNGMGRTIGFLGYAERHGMNMDKFALDQSFANLNGTTTTGNPTTKGRKGSLKSWTDRQLAVFNKGTWDEEMVKTLQGAIRYATTPSLRDSSSEPQADPMREMKFIGDSMMYAVLAMSGLKMGYNLISGLVKSFTGPFTKNVEDAAGKLKKAGSSNGGIGIMIIGSLFIALLALAVLLAWIIPALPYTTWTLAIIGYVIMFCEAMVAAPVWALAHAWPEGEGVSSGLATKGYMLFLRIMLKPLLLLFGFFIGMQILYVAGWWVDNTIWASLNDAYDTGHVISGSIAGHSFDISGNPLSTIGMLVVYTGLMIGIVHKAFEMTTELDNWVFEWIGGGSRDMGEKNASQNHVMGVANSAKSHMGQAGGQAMQYAGRGAQQKQLAAEREAGRTSKAAGQGAGGSNTTPKAVNGEAEA